MSEQNGPLAGQRVLVPRGGSWGTLVAKALRSQGATPVVAPLIDFSHTSEEEKLHQALIKLESGYYDWMTATNATVVDVLAHNNTVIAKRTQVAVVGETTYAAFIDAGYEVARTTEEADTSALGLLKVWPEISNGKILRILTMRSDVAKPVLTEGLIDLGHDVTQIVAYRTIGVPASVHVREDVSSGHINALLVSSPQVAREVAAQFADRPDSTIVACLGDEARAEAERLGLTTGSSASEALTYAVAKAALDALDPADMMD